MNVTKEDALASSEHLEEKPEAVLSSPLALAQPEDKTPLP